MKILVVDDEELIRKVIREYLENSGYMVYEATNGEKGLEIALKNDINLVIMDIMMPHMDGYTCCEEIFKVKKIPTIMLTARNTEEDVLQGFNLGIEDYIKKPFSPKELLARVNVILKRNNFFDIFTYKSLIINDKEHQVYIDNKEIKLTPKEYELLLFFVKNKNIALSRETLLSSIWDYNYFGDDRTIDTHIKMLRNNLLQYRNLIITIRGVGYKMEIKDE